MLSLYDEIQRQALEEGKSVYGLAKEIGFATSQLASWKNAKRNPQAKSWERFHDYVGAYRSQMGLGDESQKERGAILISSTMSEPELLKGMGIVDTSGDLEMNDLQGEWETMAVIHALMDSTQLDTQQKRRTIGRMFPALFPHSQKMV
jgi:hypothetical protein